MYKKLQNIIGGCSTFLLFLGACQQSAQNNTAAHQVDSTAVSLQSSVNKTEPLTFFRKKELGQKDTISFPVAEASVVKITLTTPNDTGNIRISHVIMPDGQTDGPFGKSYQDSLKTPGKYKLVISENQMQENPYTGEYTVSVVQKPIAQ